MMKGRRDKRTEESTPKIQFFVLVAIILDDIPLSIHQMIHHRILRENWH